MEEETMFYINMDRSLIRKGGIKAARISEQSLLQKVINMQKLYEPYGQTFESDEDELLNLVDIGELTSNTQISQDLSEIVFGTENFIANPEEWDEESLIGLRTLPNGMTFLGIAAGGDWEKPVFLILYWNGRALRAYVPLYGNTFNPDFRTAFGSEGSNRAVKNDEIMMNAPYNDCEVYDAGQLYLRSLFSDESQDEDAEDIEPRMNWKAIEEDILNRIEVME